MLTQDSAERPREGPARRPLRAGRAGGFIGLGLPARVPCEGIPEALLLGRCSCAALAEIFVDSGSEKAENTLSWSLHSDSVRRPPEDPARVTTQGRLRLFWSACLALGTHAAFPALLASASRSDCPESSSALAGKRMTWAQIRGCERRARNRKEAVTL